MRLLISQQQQILPLQPLMQEPMEVTKLFFLLSFIILLLALKIHLQDFLVKILLFTCRINHYLMLNLVFSNAFF